MKFCLAQKDSKAFKETLESEVHMLLQVKSVTKGIMEESSYNRYGVPGTIGQKVGINHQQTLVACNQKKIKIVSYFTYSITEVLKN